VLKEFTLAFPLLHFGSRVPFHWASSVVVFLLLETRSRPVVDIDSRNVPMS
jgi:hypothetical protein